MSMYRVDGQSLVFSHPFFNHEGTSIANSWHVAPYEVYIICVTNLLFLDELSHAYIEKPRGGLWSNLAMAGWLSYTLHDNFHAQYLSSYELMCSKLKL